MVLMELTNENRTLAKICFAWLNQESKLIHASGLFRMIAVRVPHLPKLQRSIPLTGTLVFTRISHTIRVFLFKK
jgi:hypothetical protein